MQKFNWAVPEQMDYIASMWKDWYSQQIDRDQITLALTNMMAEMGAQPRPVVFAETKAQILNAAQNLDDGWMHSRTLGVFSARNEVMSYAKTYEKSMAYVASATLSTVFPMVDIGWDVAWSCLFTGLAVSRHESGWFRLIDASIAGAWIVVPTSDAMWVITKPTMFVEYKYDVPRLHRIDGPAISFLDWSGHYIHGKYQGE